MMLITYAWRLVTRNPRRTATYLFGLALAVGLFAGILFFVDAMSRQMTATALAPVRLDIAAHTTTADVNLPQMAQTLQGQRGVQAAEPVAVADFITAQKVGVTTASPAGRMFAIAPAYLTTFDILQISQGTFDPSGVLVSEALAIAQNLRLGDLLQITFAGLDTPLRMPVTGIIAMDNADSLFATATEAENAVVADVVVVDLSWFRASLQPQLTALAANPPATLPPGAILLDQQIHIQVDRAQLSSDPTRAALQTESLRRQVERQFSGQLKAVDNLSGALKTAKADVLSAKLLFIFLGLPGVALAAYLSKFAADLFAEAQRREIGLLRTRGATPAQITGIVAVASVLLAVGGSALGVLCGALLLTLSGGNGFSPLAPGFDWAAFAHSAGIAFMAGLVLTFFAAFVPTFGTLQREIVQERRTARRVTVTPFWQRAYLDFILLAAAAVILVVTQLNGGFKPSGNEGAALSLSFYIFLAPFFAWIGLTLLTLRLVESGISRSARRLAALFGRLFGEIGEVAGKYIARRAARVSAATTIIALTLSFGISLTLFQKTYTGEKQLDAQYVVGSDLRVTPALNTPQRPEFATQLQIPGVRGVTAVARDTQALIGSEKNTVYGIDIPSFERVAYLPDSFFVDGTAQQTLDALLNHTTNYAPGSARQVLDALANTPNGVLISVEQAEKYNIQVGDPVLIRLYNPTTRQYTDVHAQAAGLFVYFPTSSQDSDFILNRDFMTQNSGNPAMNYFLLKTNGAPATIATTATALTAQFQNVMPVRIQDINTVVKTEESSLTSLNLQGLGMMERFYTVLVISVGLAIFLIAMINERQREFGAMRAMGANLRHLQRFLFSEAVTIGGLSLVLGAAVGILLARLMVMLLSVVFTIPPHGLAWAWGELGGLAGFVVIGMIVSTLLSARRLATLKVVEALREL
jgi:putative ABC transport system permease protein